jgi:hypothetical protein
MLLHAVGLTAATLLLFACSAAPGVVASCGDGDYCRQLFGWKPGSCHPSAAKPDGLSAPFATANERLHVGPEFALLARSKPKDADCLVHGHGSWSAPVDIAMLKSAATYFGSNPQTNCTIDDLETLSSLRWQLETNADRKRHPEEQKEPSQKPDALHSAQLRHTECALARLSDPFDVLALLWAASAAMGRRRGQPGVPHPRIDLAGDESHRAVLFRVMSFMRRQPHAFDALPPSAAWIRYVVSVTGDVLEVHNRAHGNRTAPNYAPPSDKNGDVLLEVNLWAVPDDSDARYTPDVEHAAAAMFDAVKSGSLLVGVWGVAYTPDETCAIENAPFAKGLLGTYRRVHEAIDDAMPLDDSGHVVASGAGATIVSKSAHVPDVLRSDLVVKRNAYSRYFMARHRRPIHTVYVEPDATSVPPMEHTLRRLAFLDVHQFVAPYLHDELAAASYGKPPRTTFGCMVRPDGAVNVAGRCRGWMDLGVFQLLVNYALAENPQW